MKKFAKEFLFRGLIACAGGPVVLAIIYGILGATNTVTSLTPHEVCMGTLTITLLAFIVAGMTAIYQMEQLPLASAILIHGAALYATYILIYLLNGWLVNQLVPILVFTGVFIISYAVIWLIIYAGEKRKTQKINDLLHSDS
ncbi:MAG: DUF3021 domain-containing protein [Ruminococcaceae bacterium]|nr:DUF3021 domain-containing protein [Oscillospiraceae bacterium]